MRQNPSLVWTSIKSFVSRVRGLSSIVNFVSMFSVVSLRLALNSPAKDVFAAVTATFSAGSDAPVATAVASVLEANGEASSSEMNP
ncbi:UNVERIFIED_CONTAM: hypothetical protein Sradi_0142400 [Sesamum radiatum]|uniref:Uncharacterized protein n=1 Tax=Sesamum radiatum TaxID=300843 RepID=A0AAW2WPI7_SESRA